LNEQARPLLSIVIPAHNEEQRLIPSLEQIDAFLQKQSFMAEVVVVENGSRDRTAELGREFAKTHPYVHVMQVITRGKGLAVKAGMMAARGAWRFICDADLSMPIEELERFLPPHTDGYDIMIATREGKGARRVDEPEIRHLIGRINNLIIKIAALPDYEDTQCGFKMFSREAAEDLFHVQQTNGIGFDVELLFIAKKRGYRVAQVPITWYFNADSKIKLVDDSLNMLREIWQIRQNWRKGYYAKAKDRVYG
jgi:glycosyltransferase involved in cell wall biosynthesis